MSFPSSDVRIKTLDRFWRVWGYAILDPHKFSFNNKMGIISLFFGSHSKTSEGYLQESDGDGWKIEGSLNLMFSADAPPACKYCEILSSICILIFTLNMAGLGVPELNGHMEKPSHYMGNFHCVSWIPPKKSPALRHAPATECQCAKPKNEASKLLVYTFQVWRFMIGFATLIKLVQTARWKKTENQPTKWRIVLCQVHFRKMLWHGLARFQPPNGCPISYTQMNVYNVMPLAKLVFHSDN